MPSTMTINGIERPFEKEFFHKRAILGSVFNGGVVLMKDFGRHQDKVIELIEKGDLQFCKMKGRSGQAVRLTEQGISWSLEIKLSSLKV
jgi:hypothetical protein